MCAFESTVKNSQLTGFDHCSYLPLKFSYSRGVNVVISLFFLLFLMKLITAIRILSSTCCNKCCCCCCCRCHRTHDRYYLGHWFSCRVHHFGFFLYRYPVSVRVDSQLVLFLAVLGAAGDGEGKTKHLLVLDWLLNCILEDEKMRSNVECCGRAV